MLPLVVVQARKFAALNTLGSVMLMLRYVVNDRYFLCECTLSFHSYFASWFCV